MLKAGLYYKKRLSLIVLVVLFLAAQATCLEAADSILSLDKANFSLNEQATITIAYPSLENTVLEIADSSSKYTFFPSNNVVKFTTQKAGNYSVTFLKDLAVLDTARFSVVSPKPSSSRFDVRNRENSPVPAGIRLLDISNRLISAHNAGEEISFPENVAYVELAFNAGNVKRISFRNLRPNGNLELLYEDVPVSSLTMNVYPREADYAFAIDPSRLDFEEATVTAVAKGNELYKCTGYNFTTRECSGGYSKIMDLVPGREFSFTLTKEDPLFTYINSGTSGCTCTNTCTTPNVQGGRCSATCSRYCDFNFTLPENATDGWLSSVHYNVTITLTSQGGVTYISGYHEGRIDKNTTPYGSDDVRVGLDTGTSTINTWLRNDNMPSSGLSSFDEQNCSSWRQGYCTWRAFINTSLLCEARNKWCTAEITLNSANYTWNARQNNPPRLVVLGPANSSRLNNIITFIYNVSDDGSIRNCTLNINNQVVNITLNPTKNVVLNFTRVLTAKSNWWEINCTDNSTLPKSDRVSAGLFNLTLNGFPSIVNLSVVSPVTLVSAGNRTVSCNGTVYDEDSYNDIFNVNATLFSLDKSSSDPDNFSNHYTNTSCSLFNKAGSRLEFNCTFSLQYYSNNGTWVCNATAIDLISATNRSMAVTHVNELLAIDISPGLVDFGSLKVFDTSPDYEVNITNMGNTMLDLRLIAYASAENDNHSMDCELGYIGLPYERFSLFSGELYSLMYPVNNSLSPVYIDINLSKREGGGAESRRKIYWKLQVPVAVSGVCKGKVIFTAI